MTITKEILRLFYNMGQRVLTRFPTNIWLQSFEYCFTEIHGENRTSSIYYHASSVNYHVHFLRDIRLIFSAGFPLSMERERLFFNSSLPLPPASKNRSVFGVSIYQRDLMMNEDFASGSRNRTTFFYYQNLYKSK